MKKIFFILLTLLTSSSHADEVFKCQLKSGKTVYQSQPCESAAKQQAIEIQKTDPRKVAEEEAKLKAWKEDFAKREEARIKAEKEQQAELDRRASVEALQRSAEYQKQQAYEAKRQADALKQQYMQNPYLQYQLPSPYRAYQPIQTLPTLPPVMSLPPMLTLPPISPFPTVQSFPPSVPHQHDAKERTVTGTQQSPHTDSGHDHSKLIFKWK